VHPDLLIRPVGDAAILIDAPDARTVQRLARWVDDWDDRDGLAEVIPGARTLYVAATRGRLTRLAAELSTAELPEPQVSTRPRVVTVDVRYDGLDLRDVAARTGLSVAEVIDLHTSTDFEVEFFGFAPGQAFLAGLPEVMRLPRRPTPRVRVPSGAVAVANEFTVIYPQDSPGGWNLIGTRVSAPLWDISAEPPNRVSVGDRVRFRPCG